VAFDEVLVVLVMFKYILKASAMLSELVKLSLCSSDDDVVSSPSCFNIDLGCFDVLDGGTLCVNLLFCVFFLVHDF
jgi:hypothetical protein